jgi:NAD(P)H-quinone oxidoreductase subunit 4
MLSSLIWIPIFGAVIIGFLPQFKKDKNYRNLSLVFAIAVLIINILIGFRYDPNVLTIQFSESISWISWLGLNYDLGIDGLSFPLICLNSLLTIFAIYNSNRDTQRPRLYYSMLLLLNGGVAGAFLAQDLLLFFLFYELEIIPLYLLIAIWGGKKRGYAAMKFLLYTAVSGILVLISFLGLVWFSGAHSFAYEPLQNNTLPVATQLLLLAPLLSGLFIKIPIFPFHTWLPDAHVEASTPVSLLLAGVLLKLGTYGLLRFAVGLLREGWVTLAPYLATLAAISALYGACCAIAQKDMKKVVAYSSIAHMAYILLAAAATTRLSLTASILQMVSHGLISALLFTLVGLVYQKTGSRDVEYLRGLLNPEKGLPVTGSLMILGVMASAGIPGMIGFISEFLVFRGSFPIFPVQTLLCLVGTGLTAVYFLLMVNKVFFGRLTAELAQIPQVLWSERIPALILSLLIIALGLQPNWVVYWSQNEASMILYGEGQVLNTDMDSFISLKKLM